MLTSIASPCKRSAIGLAVIATCLTTGVHAQTSTTPSAENAPTLSTVQVRDQYEREDLPALAPAARLPRAHVWVFWAPLPPWMHPCM